MIFAIAASLAFAALPPPQPADLSGLYVTRQMEMGGALELRADGRFLYQLDYGAASESAEGKWARHGNAIELTSDPMPKSPDFALVRDEDAPAGQLYVGLEDAAFTWSPLDVIVSIDGEAEPVLVQAEADGRVAVPAGKHASSVRLMVPVYSVAGTPVALSGDRGHRLLFRFEPNDLGKAAFRAERLYMDGSSLVMFRYETKIVFRRAGE
jgi:hypothetical protein